MTKWPFYSRVAISESGSELEDLIRQWAEDQGYQVELGYFPSGYRWIVVDERHNYAAKEQPNTD